MCARKAAIRLFIVEFILYKVLISAFKYTHFTPITSRFRYFISVAAISGDFCAEIWVTASKKGKYFVLRLSFFLPKVLWIKKVCVILPLNLIVRFYKPLNFKNKKMIVVPVKEGENIEKR